MTNRISNKYVLSQALKQGYWRLSTDLGHLRRFLFLRAGNVGPFHNIHIPNIGGKKDIGDKHLAGRFQFSGKTLDIGRQGNPWPLTAPSEQFARWQHSFSWLDDLLASPDPNARARARDLVDSWIDTYGNWNSFSWKNTILTNRLFSWLSHWPEALATDRLTKQGRRRRVNVVRQLKYLRQTYKRTPPGLTKLKAASVITLGGLFLPGQADSYISLGMDWLEHEIDLQILPDGGHISRSPLQALEALRILSTLERALHKRKVENSVTLTRAIDRLRHIIGFFLMPDGQLPSFNGGGLGNARLIDALLKEAKKPGKPFSYCPHTGYQRLEAKKTIIIMDTGEPPPVPFDKNAHLGPLAFEMSYGKKRLIVNCGWSEQQPQSWHDAIRQSAAHSALTLNDHSCGHFIDQGFAARILSGHISDGPTQVNAGRKEQAEGNWLETSHDGYVPMSGLTCRRRLYMNSNGNDIRGEDSLLIPLGSAAITNQVLPYEIRFHLHPSVRATLSQDLESALLIQPGQVAWRFRTDAGPIRIEQSVWLAEGDRPVRTEQLVLSSMASPHSDGESPSNRIRWSFKRLQNRK